MKKRLDQLSEEDFAVLSGPLDSGRQSPSGLAGTLLLAPFLLGFVVILANFFVFGDRIEPAHPVVIVICLIMDVVGFLIIVLSFVFSAKKVYKSRQSTQYFITILVSQFLFGGFFYWIVLYILFDNKQFHHNIVISNNEMLSLIIGTLLLGMLIFIIAFIRFIRLLEDGKFRKNTKRDEIRGSLENNIPKIKRTATVGGASFVLIGISLNRIYGVYDFEFLLGATVSMSLFYVMLFILPEQLVIWYSIKRFESFQFDFDDR